MVQPALFVNEDQIASIAAVPYTKTWHPVHHIEVIAAVERACFMGDLDPVVKQYQVSADGKEMFGCWAMAPDGLSDSKDVPSIGFRNSMKKTFALGVVAGNKVLVCDNMCFFGEYIEHRRHTNGLTSAFLEDWMQKAVESATLESNIWRNWMHSLHWVQLDESGRKTLLYDAIDSNILNPSQWTTFQQSWEEELKIDQIGDQVNLMHFHGAVTRTLRNSSMAIQQKRTRKLNTLCMDYISCIPQLTVE